MAPCSLFQGDLDDDDVLVSNRKGTLSFASTGEPNSRRTQLFFNLEDNPGLDSKGFAPIGEVSKEGFEVIKRIFFALRAFHRPRVRDFFKTFRKFFSIFRVFVNAVRVQNFFGTSGRSRSVCCQSFSSVRRLAAEKTPKNRNGKRCKL